MKNNKSSSFSKEMAAFIEAWEKLPSSREVASLQTTPDCAAWNSFFETFAQTRQNALNSGNCVDIFGIDEIGHKEMRYSAVLAWLLNSRADHGQGRVFFDAFLAFLQKRFPSTSMPDFSGSYSVTTESSTDTKKRMDILIEGKCSLLVIEVKVDAKEHDNQLSNYANWLREQPEKIGQLIYLTRTGAPGSSKDALPIRWTDVSRCILIALKEREKNNSSFSESISHTVISQYYSRINTL